MTGGPVAKRDLGPLDLQRFAVGQIDRDEVDRMGLGTPLPKQDGPQTCPHHQTAQAKGRKAFPGHGNGKHGVFLPQVAKL